MDRTEATGFGVAVAGHALLLGILSVGFASASRPPLIADSIEVSLVDEIGLRSALADPSTEAPAEAQAPEMGPPEEAAPAPVEAPPEPTPPPPAPKPKAVAPAPEKPAKPTPAKPAPKKAAAKKSEASAKASAERARASRIGADILKGISDPSSGKAEKPRAPVGARDLAGLAAAIIRQVKPCYVVPTGGEDSGSIETVLRLQFRKDGSVAGSPTLVEQNGLTSANRPYARQMADAARRAVLRCSPLELPAELYEGGWEDITFGFRAEALG